MKKIKLLIIVMLFETIFLYKFYVSNLYAENLPDLVEISISGLPQKIQVGKSLTIKDTIRNIGNLSAEKSKSKYYLSLDNLKDNNDILVGRRAVKILKSNESLRKKITITIPKTTPLGEYYLIACADDNGKIEESNESNNCVTSEASLKVLTNLKAPVLSNLSYSLQNGQTYNDAVINVTFDFKTKKDIKSVIYRFFDSEMNETGSYTLPVIGGKGIRTGYVQGGFYLEPDYFDTLTFQISIEDAAGFQSNSLKGTFKVYGGFGIAYKYSFTNKNIYGGNTAIGDINRDGLNDIVVAGSGSLQIFYQNTKGLLDSPLELSTNFGIKGVAIGDVNNDGNLDVVVSGNTFWPLTGKIAVFLQNPDTGQLSPPQEYTTSFGYTGNLKIADLNSDGKNDVVVVGSGYQYGDLSIFFQNSDGGLNSEFNFSAYRNMDYSGGIKVADMDNDGDNDIVIMKNLFTLAVIKQLSPGNYSDVPDLYPFIDPFALGDINGDGLNDIVNAGGGILIQNIQGTFDRIATVSFSSFVSNILGINIYDITMDGLNDIICDQDIYHVAVFPQIIDHTFGDPILYNVNNDVRVSANEALSVGDVTGDGRPDAVVSWNNEGLYVLPFYPRISKQ